MDFLGDGTRLLPAAAVPEALLTVDKCAARTFVGDTIEFPDTDYTRKPPTIHLLSELRF